MVDRATYNTPAFHGTSFSEDELKPDYENSKANTYEFDSDTDSDLHQDDACFQASPFLSDASVSESHGALTFAAADYGSTAQNTNLHSDLNELPAATTINTALADRNEALNEAEPTGEASSMRLALNSEVGKENQIKPIETFSDIPSAKVVIGEAADALKAADLLRLMGKPTEAQAKYEEALKKVKEVDMATVTTQWQAQKKEYNLTAEKLNALGNPPSNPQEAQRLSAELQQRQDTGLQLEKMIHIGKDVKVQYARFLNEQGNRNEALLLLTDVAAQTSPELLARDKTFAEQMESAQRLGSITTGNAEKHHMLFERAMMVEDYPTAQRELASLKDAFEKAWKVTNQDMKDRNTSMSKRQTEIDTELAEVKQNAQMSQEAKELRQQQLANEKKSFDELRKAIEDSFAPAEKAHELSKKQLRYLEEYVEKKLREAEIKKRAQRTGN